jgi:hypothetical protein
MPHDPGAAAPPLKPVILIVALAGGACLAALGEAAELSAGNFSFSDELGGFRLLGASGLGTPGDPIVLMEEILDAAPVTLVVRRLGNQAAGFRGEGYAQVTIVKQVVNRSHRVWAGYEIELQEVLKQPSTYGDGLSFNQFGASAPDVSSDSFANNNRLFEPYDRIRFQNGHVNPGAAAQFRITVTDPTPVPQFYIVQDPKLLSAGLPLLPSLAHAAEP